LWIQYIAFFVGLSQLDKARALAKRALSAIHFREETEKLNVWVALLNLENAYGDEESMEKVFKDAVQSNDSETIFLRTIDIYERSGKIEVRFSVFLSLALSLLHPRISLSPFLNCFSY
jgi:rRNA biogenesis protein RRP5